METVRLLRALPGYQEGQTVVCDPVSAKALIDRGDAVRAESVVDPVEPVTEAEPVALTRQSPKAELVAFAVASGWGQEQADGSTRAQIADAFGLG